MRNDLKFTTEVLPQVLNEPSWMLTAPQQIFQSYEVFTDTAYHGINQGVLLPPNGEISCHIPAENLPKSVKLRLGRMKYKDYLGFRVYEHMVTLFGEALGHIFIGIPGTTLIYYAVLEEDNDSPSGSTKRVSQIDPNHPLAHLVP